MEYKRNNGMIDINDAIEKEIIIFSEEEKKGARNNKFWFNDYTWMYKDVDNEFNTYEEYAEMISYEIAKLLDIECAEYDLAQYNGNKGVITKSLVKPNEKIISGDELLKSIYNEYFVPKMMLYKNFKRFSELNGIYSIEDIDKHDKEEQEKYFDYIIKLYNQCCYTPENFITNKKEISLKQLYEYCDDLKNIYNPDFIEMQNGIIISNNLYDVWSAVEIYCKMNNYELDINKYMNDLINMFLFDIITSQGDRHAENWSIIVDKETHKAKFAGLYDNSGALHLNREKAIPNIDDYLKRIEKESRPGKVKGLYAQLKKTIEHSFSGVKISSAEVYNRTRNDQLLDMFISQSSNEFIERLRKYVEILSDENIDKIFENIEAKTKNPVPETVKNVAKGVLKFNISKIKEKLEGVEEYGKPKTIN